MKKQDTCRLLRGIINGIRQVSDLTVNYRYEDFYRDQQAHATITGYIRTIAGYERDIPTIVRVKFVLVPWKDLDSMDETISRANPVDRPRLLWKFSTETLPQIRLLLEDMVTDMEK